MTIDCWTCADKKAFLALTVHYITLTWEMKTHVLGCVELVDPDSAVVHEDMQTIQRDLM